MERNAKILWIGEIEELKDGKHRLAIDVSTTTYPKKRFLVYENKIYSFDLIKKFRRNVFKVGDIIDFEYNTPNGNYFPSIWKIYNHKSKK